jgi:hypothetical protein
MKSKVIASHTSSQRDSWWYLIQKDDGTLHVGYESDSQGERIEHFGHSGLSIATGGTLECCDWDSDMMLPSSRREHKTHCHR